MENKLQDISMDDRLQELVGGLCNKTLSEGEHAELAALLEKTASARRYYMDYVLVHAKLSESAKLNSLSQQALPEGVCSQFGSVASDKSRDPDRMHRWSWGIAIAASLLAALPYALWQQGVLPSAEGTRIRSGETSGELVATSPLYVAQISAVSPDVEWNASSNEHELLLRLRRGDRIAIERGVVEIDYFSGAHVVLNGPSEYVATGQNSGMIVSGKLVGRVAEGDFVLTTPTARVVDLGTEFSVALDPLGNTDVVVIDGEVSVSATTAADSSDARLLTKGMAVRVAHDASLEAIESPSVGRFRSVSPSSFANTDEVSLVGVVNGVRDDRFRLAGVIAADTGLPDQHPWRRVDGPGHSLSNGYFDTTWHPFIDGVFIPSEDGAHTQVSSAGQVIDLPASLGRTWGPIWSRTRLEETASVQADFWGTDTLDAVVAQLKRCQAGMVGVHANVGITFDLTAIAQRWGKDPSEFRTIVSNLDNSLERTRISGKNPGWAEQHRFTASVRVYVDGHLKASRVDFGRSDGEETISTALSQGDRFLTIVTTDAGQYADSSEQRRLHGAFDHVVLIDPVVCLHHSSKDP